jgi:Tol biopolymer transport system component/tRNA A-37 threonylcarbamoyl transferase component Bud32
MPLSVGSKLGPYEILAKIGEGGMGEVYKARDSRLDRVVAIKVSQENFSQRFEREARAIAALNHTNICTLFDVGPNYLVMEYVEGQALKGPLPVEKAIEYGGQILLALDHAHRKGITHRDLKPANILVTKQGIKLLDFGLAKLKPAPLKETDETLTRALSKPLTQSGQILGTLQYMSAEQLQGQEADSRSDLFAFGCVLYELLTGKRAFDGQTAASVIAAILERPSPSISDVAPEALDRVLKRCLEKDPDKRWQNALDLKSALELSVGMSGDSDSTSQAASGILRGSSASSQSRLRGVSTLAAVFAFTALVLGIGYYRATRPAPLKPLVRLDVDLGPDVMLGSSAGADTVISPDGTRLVYVSHGKLFTRRLDQPKAVELADTEGASAPFFSPDGQWVAFFTTGKLKKVSVEGGAIIALCDAVSARGGAWGEDGNIVVAQNSNGGLSRVPSAGGAPTPVTQLTQGEITHRWPQILPGGKAVLFTSNAASNGFDGANIEVISLADHRRRTLQRGGTFGRYLPGTNGIGHLVYVSKGTLFAVPFDPEKLEVLGTPSPVLEDVAYNNAGSARFDLSRNGTLVYRGGGAGDSVLFTVQWLDATGKTQPLLAKPGVYQRPHLSPDGQRLALDDGSDLWVYEARRDTMTRLTFSGTNVIPVWSPDGHFIVFSGRSGDGGVWWVRSDGAGKPQPLIQSKNQLNPFSFTLDGKRLVYDETNPTTAFDIWTVPIESDGAGLRAGKPEIFLRTPADERNPAFSPDGHWLAYTSNESGTYQVYVRAFPDKGGKWQISNVGGSYPTWASKGHELFFRAEDNRIMVVTYATKADSFIPDKPRLWSDKQLANFGTIGTSSYDLAPDGNRIAALMPVESSQTKQSQNHVVFLENFFDELQRKVPVGK